MSRGYMNTLAPIKEESFLSTSSAGGTPRNVQRVTVNNRPILVQTLPPDPHFSPPPPADDNDRPVSSDRDEVDQVIADYLHFARYSASVPVQQEQWNTTDTLYCPCCKDRNQQSSRRQHGLPVSPRSSEPGRSNDEVPTYTSSRSAKSEDPPRQSWMSYQPLPYAKGMTYLNPEFNRPSMIHQFQNEMKGEKENAKVRSEILESSTKFDNAMKKLKFTTQKLDPNFDESKMSFS